MAKKSQPTKMDSVALVSWVALAISMFALAVSLGLTAKIKERASESKTVQKTSMTVDEQLVAAQSKLEEVQKLIKSGNFSKAAVLLAEVKTDLKTTSTTLTGDAKVQWEKLDTQLEALASQVQKGTANAIGSTEKALEQLRKLILSL